MIVTFLDEIAETLARAEAAAYERGREDGQQELLDELIASAQAKQQRMEPQQPRNGTTTETDGSRPAPERKRAPRGTVGRLIHRVLSSGQGLDPLEILERAETDYEKMVQAPSIRNELRRGLKQGRYRRRLRRWYLVDTGKNEAEGNPSQDAPSASNSNQGGRDAPALA